jgi:FKBP-type peptidyl-prolyl cis-trans isomerase FkpA
MGPFSFLRKTIMKNRLLQLLVSLFGLGAAPALVPGPLAADLPKEPVQELVKIDRTLGSGVEAITGKNVFVHYSGWLYTSKAGDGKGKKFDSSVDRGSPFNFPLGAGRVIAGWDQGVAGMKVGGKRTLIIPPQLGYGARGAGGVIPPNATLIFDVELLEVK